MKKIILASFMLLSLVFINKANATGCVDSDGGKVYDLQGTAKFIDSNGDTVSGSEESDICVGDDVLREFYCNGGIDKEDHACDNGCLNGACQNVNAKPDLIVESVAFYPQDPKLNVPYNGFTQVVIKNIGTAPAYGHNNIAVRLTIDATQNGYYTPGWGRPAVDLEPGASTIISVPTTNNSVFMSSPVKFTAEVDWTQAIDESNELNNVKTVQVVLYPETSACQGQLPSNAYWWVSGCWSGNGSRSANYQSSNNSGEDCDYRCYTGYQYQNGSCVVPCDDSDSGRNIFVQGVVTVNNSAKYTDQCSNTVLTEWRCENGIAKSEQITCAYGCANGICKNATAANCVDSDNGKEAFIKGWIKGAYSDGSLFEIHDECVNTKQLKEWQCGYAYTPISPITFSDQKVVFEIPNTSDYGNVVNSCNVNIADKPLQTSSFVDNVSQNLSDSSKSISISSVIDCVYGCVDGACKQPVTAVCGNGQIDVGEVCDGGLLNNQTCQNKGYDSGALKCASNCLSFDTSNCQKLNNTQTTNNQTQSDDANKLVSARIVESTNNTIILKLNRLISDLEQRVIDLETRLTTVINKVLVSRLKGQILIQPQSSGEVWYISPDTGERFYVADAQAAYGILSGMGKGIANKDLQKVSIGYDSNLYGDLQDSDQDGLPDVLEQVIGTDPNKVDTDGDGHNDLSEVVGGYNPNGSGNQPTNKTFAKKLKGIYLDVDNRGAAWYINPKDFKRYYVSPETAYNVMKYLSLGVSNDNLRQIPVGQVSQ